MPDLFADVRCASCGQSHTFRDRGVGRHPVGSVYSFTCPVTGQVTTFRSPTAESVILCPAGTIPARWEAD